MGSHNATYRLGTRVGVNKATTKRLGWGSNGLGTHTQGHTHTIAWAQ